MMKTSLNIYFFRQYDITQSQFTFSINATYLHVQSFLFTTTPDKLK